MTPGSGPGIVLVVGMVQSGVESIGDAIHRLGLTAVAGHGSGDDPVSADDGLAEFNDQLLAELGSSWDAPAMLPRLELLGLLAHRIDEARARFDSRPAGGAMPESSRMPLVWADPRLTVLAPFWAQVLGTPVSIVLVHRAPQAVARELADPADTGITRALELWDEYNRAALSLWEEFPGLVVSVDDARRDPSACTEVLRRFVAGLGTEPTAAQCRDAGTAIGKASEPPASEGPQVPNRFLVLDRVLGMLGGPDPFDASAVADLYAGYYDEEYYDHYGSDTGIPYRPGESEWVTFFSTIADRIVDELQPRSTLDVGCAIGFLVDGLHQRGVAAWGIDVSEWAIAQVPERVRSRCSVASLTDELEGHFDLITVIEVIEHLPDAVADLAIGNIARHCETVLFSSTPDGFEEATHINVRTPDYWVGLFARHGFFRQFGYDASYLSGDAILFRKGVLDVAGAIEGYEQDFWRQSVRYRGKEKAATIRADQLEGNADRFRAEAADHWKEIERLRDELAVKDREDRARSLDFERKLLEHQRRSVHLESELARVTRERDDATTELAASTPALRSRVRSLGARLIGRCGHRPEGT
jgi:hypothetical protein